MSPERRDQIEQLYRSALELPLDKQPGFIADACIGDEELRLQVESLLNQYSANAKLLKQSPSPLPSGMRIGPYQIQARLGVGGMGEVYRARDSRLGRDVAIKVLRHELAETPIRRARFEVEARAVAALNHPHIVSIFDFGEVNGNPYAVSELIEGQSLRALLRRGPVPTRKLIDIAVQIAEGLAAAHAAGIAHRDVKPENIMISGDGRIKILDFGLARSASRTSGALNGNGATVTVRVTQPGTVLGTPNYMSPEQARGEVADYRSDQFPFASDFRMYLVSTW
jgi:serine/threonine protein kinase